ncbi:uncharacterized protein LOC144159582 isoform X3 [Haemaphysalis longicornis]
MAEGAKRCQGLHPHQSRAAEYGPRKTLLAVNARCAVTLALRAEYAERRNTRRAKDAERIDRGHHWSKFSGATIPAHEAYKQPFKDPCNAVFTDATYIPRCVCKCAFCTTVSRACGGGGGGAPAARNDRASAVLNTNSQTINPREDIYTFGSQSLPINYM